MREFETGATRDSNDDKPDYNGFNSALVEYEFAKYMNKHRTQADGQRRASDNWKKGMPQSAYLESLHRHFMDLWLISEGYSSLAVESDPVEVLCAIRFNVNGLMLEKLRGNTDD